MSVQLIIGLLVTNKIATISTTVNDIAFAQEEFLDVPLFVLPNQLTCSLDEAESSLSC